MRKLKVGILELIASTAPLHSRGSSSFWAEGRSCRLPGFLRRGLLARLGHYVDAVPEDLRRDWAPLVA